MAPTNKKAAEKNVNAPPAQSAQNVETTALATNTQQQTLASAAPAWLQKAMGNRAPAGYEKMDNADFIIPRIVLAQSMTPEVVDGKVGLGDFFDNLTKRVLCKKGEELLFIPIILGKSRMLLGDFNKGEGILCRADDALTSRPNGRGKDQGGQPTRECTYCIHKEFDEENGKPACSLFYNVIGLLPQYDYRAVVWSCKHTQVKVAKRFLSTCKMTGADLFALKFALKSVTEKNEKFTYSNFDFREIGYVEQAEYARGETFFKNLEGKTWSASTDDIEKEYAAEREPGSDDAPVVEGTPVAAADDVAF